MDWTPQEIGRPFGTLTVWQAGRRDTAARTLLLLPSLGADHRMWDPQIDALAGDFRLLALDTRGHGRSDWPEAAWTVGDLVADALAVLDATGTPVADVMGLSLGGMVALGLALDHPDRCGRIVCACARADAPPEFRRLWADRAAQVRGSGLEGLWPATAERWFNADWRAAHPATLAEHGRRFAALPRDGYARNAEALATLDLAPRLPAIVRPVAYIAGEADAGMPPAVMRAMADATPGSGFHVVPGAAHLANTDNAQDFNRAVGAFLSPREAPLLHRGSMPALSDRVPYVAQPDRPRLRLPGGAKLAVWVIVNAEEWRIERAMPRTVLPPPMGQPLLPDVPNWSWHEYGMRSGFWRQHAALTARGIPVTFAVNGNVCRSYPRVAQAAKDAGWEFMGHGFLQGPMHKLDDQRAAIRAACDAIRDFTGTAPRSWESPGLTETDETLDLLREAGIDYVADWVIDDLPQDIDTPHGRITTVPYTVEMNDITVYALQQHASPEFLHRGRDQFARLLAEGDDNARVMAISIHPYITGVPHRIGYLEQLLDHIAGHEGIVWMTASEIGDWYRAELARIAEEEN